MYAKPWSRESVCKVGAKQFRHRHVRRVYAGRKGRLGERIFEIVVVYDFVQCVWRVELRNDRFEKVGITGPTQTRETLEEAKALGDEILAMN